MEGVAPEGLRYRKKIKARTSVERAALELVLERGYDGVTVEDICVRAEVSKKTFFNYFPSKVAAIVGRLEAFPDQQQLVDTIGEDNESCYIDVLVDIVGEDCPSSIDEEIAHLRREALMSMPQLFFQGQRDVLAIHRAIATALRTYLESHPERRIMPDQSIEYEVLVASSTVISIARMRSMVHIYNGEEPSAEQVRHLLIEYLSACQPDGRDEG